MSKQGVASQLFYFSPEYHALHPQATQVGLTPAGDEVCFNATQLEAVQKQTLSPLESFRIVGRPPKKGEGPAWAMGAMVVAQTERHAASYAEAKAQLATKQVALPSLRSARREWNWMLPLAHTAQEDHYNARIVAGGEVTTAPKTRMGGARTAGRRPRKEP